MLPSHLKKLFLSGLPLHWFLIAPLLLQMVSVVGVIVYLSYSNSQKAVEALAFQVMRQVSNRISDRLDASLGTTRQAVNLNYHIRQEGYLKLQNREQLRQHLWYQTHLFKSTTSTSCGFFNAQGQEMGYSRVFDLETIHYIREITGQSVTPQNLIFRQSNGFSSRNYYLVDAQGKPTRKIYTLPINNQTIVPYTVAKAAQKQTWTPIFYARVVPAWMIAHVAPLSDGDGQFQGLFSCGFLLADISTFLKELNFSPAGQTFILESSGHLVASSTQMPSRLQPLRQPPTRPLARQSQDPITRAIASELHQKYGNILNLTSPQSLQINLEKEKILAKVTSYQDAYGLNWLLVTAIPESDFMGAIYASTSYGLLICGGAILGMGALGLLTAHYITQPIKQLSQISQSLVQGKWPQLLPEKSAIKEMEILNRSLNQIAQQGQKIFQESEAKFTQIFRLSPHAISIVRLENLTYLTVNEQFLTLTGYSQTEVLNRSVENLNIIVDEEQALHLYNQITTEQGSSNYEMELRTKSGEIKTILLSSALINIDKEVFILAVLVDISERKIAEASLQENQHFIEQITNCSPQILYILDPITWNNLYVNRQIFDILGYTPEEFQQRSPQIFLDILHPQDLPLLFQNKDYWQTAQDDEILTTEYRMRHQNGSWRWLRSRDVVFARNEQQQVTKVLGTAQDISDRKEIEEALLKSEARFQQITLSSPNAIYIIIHHPDGSKHFEYISTAIEDICELSVEALLQDFRLLVNLYHPDDLPELRAKNSYCLANLASFDHEWRLVTPSGQLKWVKANARLERRANGEIARYGMLSDITERKHQEEQVKQQHGREVLLREITQRIRQTLELNIIFDTSVQEIRQFLHCDRVAILKFAPNSGFSQGCIVAEAVVQPFTPILAESLQSLPFGEHFITHYQAGQVLAVADIYQANFTAEHIQFLAQFQVRANLVLPLMDNALLWGVLCIHQCLEPRLWQEAEIDLLQQITDQLAIAIQQAHLYHQAQDELAAKNSLFLQLKNELDQKKILLKEIHHRVKNNLQIMSSLLYLQFCKSSPEVQSLSEDYQNRIQSMALIHEQLYRSEDLETVNFRAYLADLTNNIFQGYSINPEDIQLSLEIDDLTISLDQSIPLGLILNELISNALKHAFPQGQGHITILLRPHGGQVMLTVADNGVGIPPTLDLKNTDTLGMQLMYNLTEQLQGEIQYSYQNGSHFQLIFPAI